MDVTITWYVEDGYVGGDRPQSVKISTDDFEEDMTEDDIREEIYQIIADDFAEKISYYADCDRVVETILSALKEQTVANPTPAE